MVCTVSVVVFNVMYCMHGLTSIAVVMISLLHTYVPLHPHMHTIHPLTHIIHTHIIHAHIIHS